MGVWREISDHVFLPTVTDPGTCLPIHQEYTGYDGHVINQADVALLQ